MFRLEEEKRKLKERDRPKGTSAVTAVRTPRANLGNIRVVQPNLVYAVGLSMDICHEDILKEHEFFGQFGKTIKISVNRSNQYASALAKHGPTGSAYVTFKRAEDALRCIKTVDGSMWRGKPIKACFGTTKYCNAFLKGMPCNNPDCLYLHELADEADCLTKEEVAAGLLPARFLAMGATNTFKPRLTINLIPNAATAAAQAAAAAAAAAGQPPAAIAAAAAAAGGINRLVGPPTKVLTVPNSSSTSTQSHDPLGYQREVTSGSSWGAIAAGGSDLAASAALVPAHLQSGNAMLGSHSHVAPKGMWAAAVGAPASGGSSLTGIPPPRGPPPPPPSDNQEWPTLASAPSAPGVEKEVVDESSHTDTNEGLARAPSMAEQLARAHSNPQEGRLLRAPKKLLPLSSPGKLKPLGKAVVARSTSPALEARANGRDVESGNERPTANGHAPLVVVSRSNSSSIDATRANAALNSHDSVAHLRQGVENVSLTGGAEAPASVETEKLSGIGIRAPPPGFAPPGLTSATTTAATQQVFHYPWDSQQQQQQARAPPPGFSSHGAGQAVNSSHSSADSMGQSLGASAGGGEYSPFGGPLGGRSMFSSHTLPGTAVGASSIPPPPPRRDKSRFAFAQADDEDERSRTGLSNSTSTGLGAQQQAPYGGQQPDAPSFFKSIFPSANVAMGPQAQQTQQAYQPRPTAPPPGFHTIGGGHREAPSGLGGLGGLTTTDLAQNRSYDPLSGLNFLSSATPTMAEKHGPVGAPSNTGVAPGLALLRQLQSCGTGQTHGAVGNSSYAGHQGTQTGTSTAAPPGFVRL